MRKALLLLCIAAPLAWGSEPGDSARRHVDLQPVEPAVPPLTTGQVLPPGAGADVDAPLRLQLPDNWEPLTPSADEAAELSLEAAVFTALTNNRSLAIQQLQPAVTGTFEAIERATFDPVLFAEVGLFRERVVRQPEETEQDPFELRSRSEQGELGVRQVLPTGTDLEVSVRSRRQDTDRGAGFNNEQFDARAGITLTQALLQGGRIDSNLARLRQAELDTLASVYELRGFTESLVADVETAYWETSLEQRRVKIFQEALTVAEQQLEETRRRISAGQIAETEEAFARAEVALRRQGLINARGQRDQRILELLQLTSPPGANWDQTLDLTSDTELDMDTLPALDGVRNYTALARGMRPELNEARLRYLQGDLEVVRTRNGLLPRLDLFVTLGQSGYADAFGRAWRDIDGPGYDYSAGLRLEVPLGRRQARAEQQRAELERYQAVDAIANLKQLAELDVRRAWIETQRSREQLAATAVTRELQEEVLRAEQARFRAGTATALAVALAQRDLLEGQLEVEEARVRYRQAVTELHRQSGTLLIRRGIAMAGDEQVMLDR
ncbi:outer membrane protein TolC [Natronocella acetinitrilica]|uniref:Outer membrane protein TolC n=1 Tax=Natronocella acetinitrilica TaxID=414046 RepID=A0AAE3GA86_9GAMM|nr:TolC family protein [Natronocella acetinitrilica]MCP1676617.1 outer membrane protein TolC [Natronocella acetinitrilica]